MSNTSKVTEVIIFIIIFLLLFTGLPKQSQMVVNTEYEIAITSLEKQVKVLTQRVTESELILAELKKYKDTFSSEIIEADSNSLAYNFSEVFSNLKTHMERKGLDSDTATMYADLIEKSSLKYDNLDPYKVMAVIDVETGGENPPYNTKSVSSAGARGIMQIMPFHADDWNIPVSDLFIPEVNIERGCFYLNSLIDRFDEEKGILAYNQGEGNVLNGTYKVWYGERVANAYNKIINEIKADNLINNQN